MSKKRLVLLILSLNFSQISKINQSKLDENVGGAENQILLWVNTLEKTKKFRIHIISKRFSFNEPSKTETNSISLNKIFSPHKLFLFYFIIRSLISVLRINKKERINLIHINPPPLSLFLSYIIKTLIKIPTFYKFPSIFSKSIFTSNFYIISQPWFLNLAKKVDRIQCISSQIFKHALKMGFNKKQLTLIPNGIPTTPYISISRNFNQKIQKIIFIGRFVKEKGISLLINAFSEINKIYPDSTLSLYGRGPERKKIIQLIEKLKLQNRVLISSFQGETNKIKILKEHHLFILPSFFEGLSNALLEALCSGMPVVVSDIPSNKELIKDNETGLLFKNGDKESLVQKMLYCINNPEKVWQLGMNGRSYCENHYALKKIQVSLFKTYNDLIQSEGFSY